MTRGPDIRDRAAHASGTMARALVLAFGLCLAGLSVTAMVLALRGAPAFDETARRTGAFGDWRVPDSHALYMKPDYLFQLAFGYLQADAFPSAATEGPDEIAALETALGRVTRAHALLEESLALAPASARTWVSLAWAQALMGDIAAAQEALLVSWRLAPNNLGLAAQRAGLADVVAPSEERTEWSAGVARDLEMLQRFGAEQIDQLLGDG